MARSTGRPPPRRGGQRRVSTALLAVGDEAPLFEAPASDGKTYTLERLTAKQAVVLVFYPGNNTPG